MKDRFGLRKDEDSRSNLQGSEIMDSVVVRSRCLWSLVFIVSFLCRGTFSDMGKMSSSSLQNHFSSSTVSHFTTKNNTKVIAQKGGLAILPCAVKLNSPATVSWMRRREFQQLLTVGLSTHSSDGRFLVEHTRHMGHWSLRIKSVRDEDRGLYECQLSIYPIQSIFVELKVVEAFAEILGAPDLHIDEGSTLRLECKLRRFTEAPSFVFWYHNNKMVNYDTLDGFKVVPQQAMGITGATDIESFVHFTNSVTSANSFSSPTYLSIQKGSVLTINEVHFNHAGNYTCCPSNAKHASINVHVLRSEKPAAMQHANRSTVEEGKSESNSFRCEYQRRQPLRFLAMLLLICTYHKVNR